MFVESIKEASLRVESGGGGITAPSVKVGEPGAALPEQERRQKIPVRCTSMVVLWVCVGWSVGTLLPWWQMEVGGVKWKWLAPL